MLLFVFCGVTKDVLNPPEGTVKLELGLLFPLIGWANATPYSSGAGLAPLPGAL